MISLNIVEGVGKNLRMKTVTPTISPQIFAIPLKNVKNVGLSGMLRIIIGMGGRGTFALNAIAQRAVIITTLSEGVILSPLSSNHQRRTESSPLILKPCNTGTGKRVKCTTLTL